MISFEPINCGYTNCGQVDIDYIEWMVSFEPMNCGYTNHGRVDIDYIEWIILFESTNCGYTNCGRVSDLNLADKKVQFNRSAQDYINNQKRKH